MPPPNSSVSLCWEKTFIEGPTRQFIKDILDFKVGTEWRFTLSVQKLEPDKEKKRMIGQYYRKKSKAKVELDVQV